MADESQQQYIRGIHWREAFPFTHLFRAFRISIHPSKLILGLVALLGLYTGGRILDGIWPARHLAVPDEVSLYDLSVRRGATSDVFIRERARIREGIEQSYASRLQQIPGAVKDRDEALNAAARAEKLKLIKDDILKRREARVEAAKSAKDQAYRNADSAP